MSMPPRRATTFQSAHDETEWLLYQHLWHSGKPTEDGDRVARGGLARLQKACHRSRPAIRRALAALRSKLAIAIQLEADPRYSRPRLWLIHSMRNALELRRQAGLVWVSRTRGVRFVDELGHPVVPTARPAARPKITPGQDCKQLPLPLIEVAAVHAALSKIRPVDDHAALFTLESIRAEVPDATADEIVFVIEKQTALAWRRGNVRDVMAWTISTTIRQAEPGLWGLVRRKIHAQVVIAEQERQHRELADNERIWRGLELIADPRTAEIIDRIRAAAIAEFSPKLGLFSTAQLPTMLAAARDALQVDDLDALIGRALTATRKRA